MANTVFNGRKVGKPAPVEELVDLLRSGRVSFNTLSAAIQTKFSIALVDPRLTPPQVSLFSESRDV